MDIVTMVKMHQLKTYSIRGFVNPYLPACKYFCHTLAIERPVLLPWHTHCVLSQMAVLYCVCLLTILLTNIVCTDKWFLPMYDNMNPSFCVCYIFVSGYCWTSCCSTSRYQKTKRRPQIIRPVKMRLLTRRCSKQLTRKRWGQWRMTRVLLYVAVCVCHLESAVLFVQAWRISLGWHCVLSSSNQPWH